MTNDESKLPEGPLDPFDDDVPLGSGPDDQEFLRTPGTLMRIVSSMIDVFFIALCIIAPSTLLPLLFISPVKGQKFSPAENRTIVIIGLLVVVAVIVGCAALERLGGGTPGRRLLRLKLVALDGSRPTWGQLLLRYAPLLMVALIPLAVFVLFLALLYSSVQVQHRDGLDLLARTRVVVND